MTHVIGEQPGGGGHMRRGDHGGVDGRVKISPSQPEQVLEAGTVSVQCLGTRPGLAASAPARRS